MDWRETIVDTGQRKPVTRRSFLGWMAAVAGFIGWPLRSRDLKAESVSHPGLPHGIEAARARVAGARRTIVLDGTWQLAKGNLTDIPAVFDRQVPVPGLLSLATPPLDLAKFDRPAQESADSKKESKEEAFWYRRTFSVAGPIPAVARLKIAKAMFGTRVFLNGKRLGDHDPSFTPGYFNAKDALKTGENELIVRIGANRGAVSRLRAIGLDWEKKRDIPGIFDSVELILSGTPGIVNVQVGPDIYKQQARVRVQLAGARASEVALVIREAESGKVAGRATVQAGAAEQTLDVTVPLPNCRLWSPEDPFLYRLTVQTEGDEVSTRFGMREFKFDPATGRAMLNGKLYYMRGSNITLYRFFEDSECGRLPWDENWVRLLHERAKDMHWNCLRYSIGLAPKIWYDIADEMGILIGDEFPLWYGTTLSKALEVDAEDLESEFTEWMQEQWNHPSVVIWDACNETLSATLGPVIRRVRKLDLSNRPWNNGYNPPQEPGDMFEAHPYHFGGDGTFTLAGLATIAPVPHNGMIVPPDGKHAVVINEYGWLWLNRDGTPTTLTQKLYQNLLGANATPAQRFHVQATYLAADTEYWRAHRAAAAVMHFTMLGYSRPDGQTCDNWTKGGVARLEWEPEFYKYVRDAFAPVGMLIDFFAAQAPAGSKAKVPVVLINDLYDAWSGPVTLRVKRGDRVLAETRQDARIEPLATARIAFDMAWPEEAGPAVLEAELHGADGKAVHSIREVAIVAAAAAH